MSGSQKPLEPVAPDGMELLFFYRCPHCLRHVPLVNPVEPRNVRCDGCGKQFPIIPVDEHGLHYVRIMLANGKAAANPDYLYASLYGRRKVLRPFSLPRCFFLHATKYTEQTI